MHERGRCGQLEFEADELLECNVEVMLLRMATTVDHGVGFDCRAAIELDSRRRHIGHSRAEHAAIAERVADHFVQSAG